MHKLPIFSASRAAAALFFLSLSGAAHGVEPGSTREQTTRELGRPQGTISRGAYEILLYPAMEIVLRDGVVQRASAIRAAPPRPAQAQQRDAARSEARSSREEEAQGAGNLDNLSEEEAAWERLRLGRIERFQTLRDAAFLAKPAQERAAYWKKFQERFPEIDVTEEYEAARKQADAELAAKSPGEPKAADGSPAEATQAEPEQEPARLSSSKQRKLQRSGTGGSEDRPGFLPPVRKFKP